jgi:hypothetical protein
MADNNDSGLILPDDGRQSERALAIRKGVGRLMITYGYAVLPEITLPTGRRADLVCLNQKGSIWIIEIKSSVADFRADNKWQDYLVHCDEFSFATGPDVPPEIFPDETGLIVSDIYGGDIIRPASTNKITPAARKQVYLACARTGAQRQHYLEDPGAHRGSN